MLNFEKYFDDIQKEYYDTNSLEDALLNVFDANCSVYDINISEALYWLKCEYSEPLLTELEQEFLQDLRKWYGFDSIIVDYTHVQLLSKISNYEKVVSRVPLPALKGDCAFEKLSVGRVYTLKELGLKTK